MGTGSGLGGGSEWLRGESEKQKYRMNRTSHRQRHRGVYRVAAQLEMCGHLKLTHFGSWTS